MAEAIPLSYFRTTLTGVKMYLDSDCTQEEKFDDTDALYQFYTITLEDLFSLHLSGYDNSSYLRNKVCEHLHLGFCSTNKTFLKRLNALQVNKKILQEVLERITKDDCE